jgi:hypothetical protein
MRIGAVFLDVVLIAYVAVMWLVHPPGDLWWVYAIIVLFGVVNLLGLLYPERCFFRLSFKRRALEEKAKMEAMKKGSPPDSGEISGPDEDKQMNKAGSHVNHHHMSPGERIDDFKILEKVGEGAMGVVYKAYEKSLKRVVALKVLHQRIANAPSLTKRFSRGAILAANLNHSNIVPVFHIEERQFWMRSCTHTVVFDRDPDYANFVQDQGGSIGRIVRVWVAEPKSGRPCKRAYLGAALFLGSQFDFSELHLVFHRVSAYAAYSGGSARTLRHQLADVLRKHICKECKINR